jgi:hypothetical protein
MIFSASNLVFLWTVQQLQFLHNRSILTGCLSNHDDYCSWNGRQRERGSWQAIATPGSYCTQGQCIEIGEDKSQAGDDWPKIEHACPGTPTSEIKDRLLVSGLMLLAYPKTI